MIVDIKSVKVNRGRCVNTLFILLDILYSFKNNIYKFEFFADFSSCKRIQLRTLNYFYNFLDFILVPSIPY